MVGSHEEESCRLFDQAIYTYLISCRIGSGFRIELSSQASQSDPSARVQLLNSTRHFSKKIPIRPDPTRSVYSRVSKSDHQQIHSTIKSAATILSEISKNSLLSIGKSLDLKSNTVHYIVKDAKKKAEDDNRKLLD